MIIGIPTGVKNNENRVAATPAGIAELTAHGHRVVMQEGAGEGSAFTDAEFIRAGAHVAPDASTVWGDADLILKVKEPVSSEYALMRKGQVLFTYLHLAANAPLTEALLSHQVTPRSRTRRCS